ncbi:MAG TPA: LysM peptidoglycan-binding domain-containing protein, partial [Patescibacteria group bacterium]
MPRKKKNIPAKEVKKRGRPSKSSSQNSSFTKNLLSNAGFKWGESYTSFLLGVVVVIVGVLFGVTLVKQHQNVQDTSSIQLTPSTPVQEVSPSVMPGEVKVNGNNRVYTVKSGDDLWSIAEKFYESGYNWVDIAKANNLSSPDTINVGNELIIPEVTSREKTVTIEMTSEGSSISGNTYTVTKGDDLWNIAVRAYGDGYKWVDIAKANNLSNPGLIF